MLCCPSYIVGSSSLNGTLSSHAVGQHNASSIIGG
jgi:hypothetical protein